MIIIQVYPSPVPVPQPVSRSRRSCFSDDGYEKWFEHTRDVIPILHWGLLPVLPDQLLLRHDLDPDVDTLEFYHHQDCMFTLAFETISSGEHLTNVGDKSLNQKLDFTVTRRWVHFTSYMIERTVDGWYCFEPDITGESEQDGTGALLENLRHDLTAFPEDELKHALTLIWVDADNEEIDLSELKQRFWMLGEWISSVNRTFTDGRPDWIEFYHTRHRWH